MNVVIWSKYNCTYCDAAKKLCESRGIEYEERIIGEGYTKEQLLEAVPTARTVPQIFVDDALVGGFTEFRKYIGE